MRSRLLCKAALFCASRKLMAARLFGLAPFAFLRLDARQLLLVFHIRGLKTREVGRRGAQVLLAVLRDLVAVKRKLAKSSRRPRAG